MSSSSQTEPFLHGDLRPRLVENTDIRNDNAGRWQDQLQSIVMRYLETVQEDALVSYTQMVEDITRHWPFHGENEETFRDAILALEEQGLLRIEGEQIQINKVGHVAHRWLKNVIRASR